MRPLKVQAMGISSVSAGLLTLAEERVGRSRWRGQRKAGGFVRRASLQANRRDHFHCWPRTLMKERTGWDPGAGSSSLAAAERCHLVARERRWKIDS
jgi:hypothetical protein